MHSSSSTSAMEQMFTDHAASIDTYVSGLAPVDGQIGALFAIGDHIVGFDLFDDAGTFRKLLPKLVRSYAVDAIDMANGSALLATTRRAPARTAIAHLVPGFLAAIAAAPQQRATAVGLGDDVRVSGNGLVGAALLVNDQVLHLSGFSE